MKPKKTGNNITDITISLADSAPQGGLVVDLTVEAIEGSGGHSHDGSRQKGEITDDSGNKINSITFAEGETEKRAKYKASEIAGEEKLIAEIRGGLTKCEETVNVKVPGLFDLGVGGSYRLTGSTGTHPANHYGTDSTIVSVNYMANDYLGETGTILGINDMSLPWGGLFDVNENWSAPHSWHRIGESVDIDRCADGVLVDQTLLDEIATGSYGATRIVERALKPPPCAGPADTPRIHYEFSGAGIRIIPVPPIGGGGGDTGGGTVEGGPIVQ